MDLEFWNSKIELMKREDLEMLQVDRLKNTLISVYENVTFYKKGLMTAELILTNFQVLMKWIRFLLQQRRI